MVTSTYLWSLYCELYFYDVIRLRGEVLGTVPSDAITLNGTTNSFGSIRLKSAGQHDSFFNGTQLLLLVHCSSLFNNHQIYNVPLVSLKCLTFVLVVRCSSAVLLCRPS